MPAGFILTKCGLKCWLILTKCVIECGLKNFFNKVCTKVLADFILTKCVIECGLNFC